MKFCKKCKLSKDFSCFGNHKRNSDGLQNMCKECKRSYDNDYFSKLSLKCRKNKIKVSRDRRASIIKEISEYVLSKGCKDCGYNSHYAAMQFDHRNPSIKSMNVSDMIRIGYSIENIYKEISKCDIVCANCHFIRTAKQFDWYKSVKDIDCSFESNVPEIGIMV